MENAIQRLIDRLQRIAAKNEDEFEYCIDIAISRRGLQYVFEASETADRHTFLSGNGPTIGAAVESAAKSIDEACEAWGYESVD